MGDQDHNIVLFPRRWRLALDERAREFLDNYEGCEENQKRFIDHMMTALTMPQQSRSHDLERYCAKLGRLSRSDDSVRRLQGVFERAQALIASVDATNDRSFLASLVALQDEDELSHDQRRLIGIIRRAGEANDVDVTTFRRMRKLCRRAELLLDP